jgi:hypothetical protein
MAGLDPATQETARKRDRKKFHHEATKVTKRFVHFVASW